MRPGPAARDVVACTVISHQPYGLLVEMENNEKGIIRIRETSWDAAERSRWKHHFPPGSRLPALVLKREEGRYAELSARLAQDDPWDHVLEDFREGQVVKGIVTGVKHYGAFVEVRPGLTGLLHRSRLPAWRSENILDLFWPGDMVKVLIQKIDPKQKQISLASAPVITFDEGGASLAEVRSEQRQGKAVQSFDLLAQLEERLSIVVVEDDPEQGKGTVNYLENLGQRVSLAGSAEESLVMIEREVPDLALVDIHLPGMDGITLIQTIRERWPRVQCVLATSWGYLEQQIGEIERLKEMGVLVLLKPLMPDDLVDLLTNLETGLPSGTARQQELASGRLQGMSALPDIDQTSFQNSLRRLLQRCLEITEFDLAVLFCFNPVHRRVDILDQFGELRGARSYLDDLIYSPVRDVAEDGDEVLVEDVEAGNYDARFRYLLQSYPFKACLGVRVPSKLVQDYALFLFDEQAREIYHEEAAFAQATALAIGSLLERKTLIEQLRSGQKMTMLGHLSSYLSHELNHALSPLSNSIKNLSLDLEGLSAVVSRPAGEEKKRDRMAQDLAEAQGHLRDLRKSVISLTETIRAFRDLLSVGKKQIVNMGELVQDTLTLLRQTSAVSRVKLFFESGENLMAIRSQMPLLQHVLLNLVMNAIEQIAEFRPREGGQVMIRVERLERANGAVIRVTVADNGPGIHWRLWEKIFEAGFTTRPDGSGLGLYIARNIVESLGGRLYVAESYINGGTVFAVDLPGQI